MLPPWVQPPPWGNTPAPEVKANKGDLGASGAGLWGGGACAPRLGSPVMAHGRGGTDPPAEATSCIRLDPVLPGPPPPRSPCGVGGDPKLNAAEVK